MYKLAKHRNLGIDIDGTLIEGKKSYFLQEWVKKNYFDKKLWLITFRNSTQIKSVWLELSQFGLKHEYFAGIKNMPDRISTEYVRYQRIANFYDTNYQKFQRTLKYYDVTEKEVFDELNRFLFWKAKMCKHLGCTVLIDDMSYFVEEGCKKFNIEYIHPDDLYP